MENSCFEFMTDIIKLKMLTVQYKSNTMERVNYTIRMTAELKDRLTAKSKKLKMTVGNTIEYLLEQEQKQIDYFDYQELLSRANELETKFNDMEKRWSSQNEI